MLFRYHHLTVMCYGFYTFSVFPSTGRWFMVMNYYVHSIMYSYYALRAMRSVTVHAIHSNLEPKEF